MARDIPLWVSELSDEDLVFVKRFVLASGSLKAMAKEYGVSYPTIRLRLDRVIDRIQALDGSCEDAYIALIKQIALDGGMDVNSARTLIAAYRKEKEER